MSDHDDDDLAEFDITEAEFDERFARAEPARLVQPPRLTRNKVRDAASGLGYAVSGNDPGASFVKNKLEQTTGVLITR